MARGGNMNSGMLSKGSDIDISSALEVSEEMKNAMDALYDKLDVKKQNEIVKSDVKHYIDGLVRGRVGDADITVAKFAIDMLVNMEARSLTSAFKQVMYLDHIIDTLMVRIDENFGGGAGDYYTLMNLQGALMTMQQHLMQLVRQLPVNIQQSVNVVMENFSIDVQAIEKETDQGMIIAKSSELIENIERISIEVEQRNKEIDDSKPDELPKDWIISDDALLKTKTIEEAREYDKFHGIGGSHTENLEGAEIFPDNEFDDDED